MHAAAVAGGKGGGPPSAAARAGAARRQQRPARQQERRQPTQPAAPAPPAPEPAVAQPGGLPRVVLKGGKAKLFAELLSPMVFSGAVDRVVGRPAPRAGDAVLVCDGSEKTIGWGVFNPDSMFRVRIMQTADEMFGGGAVATGAAPDLRRLLGARIRQAVELRAALGLRCGPAAAGGADRADAGATTVFRLVNSEGDRLSGLIVDALGQHLVVASSAAWVEQQREAITECLREATGLSSVIWRPAQDMLREEGCEPPAGVAAGGASGAAAEHAEQRGEAGGEGEASPAAEAREETVVVVEKGIRFHAAPRGQKTGFYADQRESRAAVRRLAAGRRVLDLCCYSGGFALSAAAGGAAHVVGVDSSAAALALAAANAELNGWQGACAFVRADAAGFMREAAAEGRRWDIVVLDPPKLAPNRRTLDNAARKYRRLNAAAMQLVEPGGLLMTCSCSGAMSQSGSFVPMLQAAARDAGRRLTLLRAAGAAPCHTLDPAYPEGEYLTNVLVRVL